ncbi:MAG: S8 family serine peptidase, partial [Erysipelotrichaceae bacterium]|nr:S8 family serine peptidase [Erysipelotrichaceae bacterium]
MKKRRENTGRKITVSVCAVLLSAGWILPSAADPPLVKSIRAEELSEATGKLLKAGEYVEGEALVFAADSEMTTYSLRGDDLLAQAEEVYSVDSGIENPMKAYSAYGEEEEPDRIKGSIKLVKSSTMSTEELIESLYEDPRVVYAEPNYILTVSEPESGGDEKEAVFQKDSSRQDSDENSLSGQNPPQQHQSAKKDQEAEKKEQSSDSKDSSAEKTAQTEQPQNSMETAEAGEVPSASSFGPSGYTPEQIPDMTAWQWGNWNNGSLAGTYTHFGTVDTQYSEWKTQNQESMPEYVIGVLDTGIDERNPDLAQVLWTGEIFGPGGDSHGYFAGAAEGKTSTTGLEMDHGSHVAGIIASQWNGQGTSGVASNAKLMALRFDLSLASGLSAMMYAKEAVKQGVNLIAINNSWGLGSNAADLISIAVTDLGENGIVSIFASGNDSADTDQSLATSTGLANNPYAVTVNAADPDGKKASYSNYGLYTTDVLAPGSLMLSAALNQEDGLTFMGEINAHALEGSAARRNL